jgi:hypothetical protein
MLTLMEPKTFYRDLFNFRRDFDENFNHLIANVLGLGMILD